MVMAKDAHDTHAKLAHLGTKQVGHERQKKGTQAKSASFRGTTRYIGSATRGRRLSSNDMFDPNKFLHQEVEMLLAVRWSWPTPL